MSRKKQTRKRVNRLNEIKSLKGQSSAENNSDGERTLNLKNGPRDSTQKTLSSGETEYLAVKWKYLTNQINNLFSDIQDSRRRIQTDKKLLYVSLATFVFYSSAPATLPSTLGQDIRVAFGATGVFFVITLAYLINHHVRKVGASIRKNMIYYKQINLIRGIAYRDGFFGGYHDLVLPIDIEYAVTEGSHELEKHPSKGVRSAKKMPYFYSILTVLLVFAFYFFVAVVMKATHEQFGSTDPSPEGFFAVVYFKYACIIFAPATYYVIHHLRNTCLTFNRSIWEGKRSCPERPNPVFPGPTAKYKRLRKAGSKWAFKILSAVWGIQVSCLAVIWFSQPNPPFAPNDIPVYIVLLESVWIFVSFALLFLGLKIYDVHRRISDAEPKMNRREGDS